MREIKFRAWDKRENEWLLGYELPNLGGFSIFGELMMMGEWAALISSRIADLENIAVMQFTGLKDVDGVPIYEGDILGWLGSKGLVYWSDIGCWAVKWSPKLAHNEQLHIVVAGPSSVKVIGNEYQHPELLT